MTIKLLSAERVSLNHVSVTYLSGDSQFKVQWSNICPGTGNHVDQYDLQAFCESIDENLEERVADCLREGETDNNDDLQLYLDIRDTFSSLDCVDLPTRIRILEVKL